MEKLKAITQTEIQPTLHVGRNDSPELGVDGMQKLFDAHPDLNTQTLNQHAEAQNANNAAIKRDLAISVQSQDVRKIRINSDNQLETSLDGTHFTPTGSSGHLILDSVGTMLPQRGRLRFAGESKAIDNPATGETVVNGIKGDKGDVGNTGPIGPQGAQGLIGKVYLPVMTDDGDILWQLVNDSGTIPPQRNIRGPQGIQGTQGIQGMQGSKAYKAHKARKEYKARKVHRVLMVRQEWTDVALQCMAGITPC